MVSLGDNSRQSGGYFFTDSDQNNLIQSHDNGEVLPNNILFGALENEIQFRPVNTHFAIIIHCLILIIYEVSTFVLPILCPGSVCGISSYAIVTYCHGILWLVFVFLDIFYRKKHQISRKYGYLDFYRKTRNVRRAPLAVISAGTVVLFIVSKLLEDYCDNLQESCGKLSKLNYFQIPISLEVITIVPVLFYYLVKTIKFNKTKAIPDVIQEDILNSYSHQSVNSTGEIGFRDENHLDQVLEKQADMIRYLQQHNAYLGRRMLTLQAEINVLKGER